jgi:hypothetical protein
MIQSMVERTKSYCHNAGVSALLSAAAGLVCPWAIALWQRSIGNIYSLVPSHAEWIIL